MSSSMVDRELLHFHFNMEVTPTIPTGSVRKIGAVLVIDPEFSGPRTVCFGFPGGGYNKFYYLLDHPDLTRPSQAEYHARRGIVFISCDPFGDGDGTRLAQEERDLETTARAVDSAVAWTLERLRAGTLGGSWGTVEVDKTVGIGHSLGAMQLIVQQALYSTFDAIAVLGFSAVHSMIPTSNGYIEPGVQESDRAKTNLEDAWTGPIVENSSHLRFAYHCDDVPQRLVDEDMNAGFPTRRAHDLPPWISQTFPPFVTECLNDGIVGKEAALVDVPVFVGTGQIDIVPDLEDESNAYKASPQVTLYELGGSAHMHNFSPKRQTLWSELHEWFEFQS